MSSKLKQHLFLFLGPAIFLFGALSGCSTVPPDDAANNIAAVDALNTWWKEFTYSGPPPVKAGTVTPVHTITSKNGKAYNVPKHVQTKKEAEADAEDARYAEHKRALVQGFSVKGQTVTVLTNLTRDPSDIGEAQELCRNLGAFVWANPYRTSGCKISGSPERMGSCFRRGLV